MLDALFSSLISVADPVALLFAGAVLFVAYAIFGLTGFGSSVTAIPFLIQVFPLHVCVTIMLLFDLVACSLLNLRDARLASKVELKRILPGLLLGAILGIFLSLHAPKKPLFMLLGVFVIAMVIWNNFFSHREYRVKPIFAFPLSFLGGAFTTLFGTGGPMYTVYLLGRVDDKRTFRSTMGALIGTTSVIRFILFFLAGFLSSVSTFVLAAVLFPSVLAGFWLGSALNRRASTALVKKMVWGILLIGGISALIKGL
ncbi:MULTISPECIES: sulfite exporter TauE/SafE family protein [unclassified Castellaniella]|uniref:sulfite exporter TauE/SafE family protein n=1 Tax=unclassified Castellaniella TaxID=2617606 RepID=UPI003315FE2B